MVVAPTESGLGHCSIFDRLRKLDLLSLQKRPQSSFQYLKGATRMLERDSSSGTVVIGQGEWLEPARGEIEMGS